MSECACKPGTYEDGWQERRCEPCLRVEIEAWGHVRAWMNGNAIARLKAHIPPAT